MMHRLVMFLSVLHGNCNGGWDLDALQPKSPLGTPGAIPAYLILQQKGSEVTGSGGSDASQQFPIEKGEISGETVRFQVTFGPGLYFGLQQDDDSMNGNVRIEMRGRPDQEGTVSLQRRRPGEIIINP